MNQVTNIVFAGLGGQGIITASDLTADAALRAGLDVKKSEVHGMSQRGGSVSADVRFGLRVFSPMVPAGEADFLLCVDATQVELNRYCLRPGGRLIDPACVDASALPSPKCLNIALVGILSVHLPLPEATWLEALRSILPPKLIEMNLRAWAQGRASIPKDLRL